MSFSFCWYLLCVDMHGKIIDTLHEMWTVILTRVSVNLSVFVFVQSPIEYNDFEGSVLEIHTISRQDFWQTLLLDDNLLKLEFGVQW